MELTLQEKNYKVRYLVSYVYSALVVFIILLIPIRSRINYDTQQEKFISVKLIKSHIPANFPDHVNPAPLINSPNSDKTTIPKLPELDVVESKLSSDSYYSNASDPPSQNSQESDYYSNRKDNLYSEKPKNEHREVGLDSDNEHRVVSINSDDEHRVVGINSDDENVDIKGYNYGLLLNYDEERAAFLKEINEGLLKSNKKIPGIEIPDMLVGQLRLLPIKK